MADSFHLLYYLLYLPIIMQKPDLPSTVKPTFNRILLPSRPFLHSQAPSRTDRP
jgi:hypothetical protein